MDIFLGYSRKDGLSIYKTYNGEIPKGAIKLESMPTDNYIYYKIKPFFFLI